MNRLKGFIYGLATSVTFGLIPLFTLPLMQGGMSLDSILFYRFLCWPWCRRSSRTSPCCWP